MKKDKIYYIVLVCMMFFAISANAQDQPESLRDRIARRQQQQNPQQPVDKSVPKLSVRAQRMNEYQTQDISGATWVREVYRFLDLKKGSNAALYYPVQPIGERMNLYTLMFKLIGGGNMAGYSFNDGQDVFTDDKKIDFKDILERLEIPYQRNANVFTYDDFSIPSNEVMGYYIKEAWYFDQTNAAVGVKTIAICPVLFRQEFIDGLNYDDQATVLREPQFWIQYEDLRPYAARMLIMTSDENNVMSKTIDDYFRLRLYDGEIYKITNMENKYLNEKYKTEEELKQARERIESELKAFDKSLWVINDSIKANDSEKYKIEKKSNKKPSKPKSSSASNRLSVKDIR